MKKWKIGGFDSGKGGTVIFKEIKKLLPEAEYFYIADTKNCPYGEKSDDELWEIVTGHVEKLKKWGADVIVIACNTATTRCIEKLRKKYPDLNFVGTEPAIRLATKSGAKKVLVMATPGTIQSERMAKLLIENQKVGQKVELLSCEGLADAIEADQGIDEKLEELLKGVKRDFDAVVLGCTHYTLIKNRLQNFFPKAILVDGNFAVAKRVLFILRGVVGDVFSVAPDHDKHHGCFIDKTNEYRAEDERKEKGQNSVSAVTEEGERK